MATYKNDRAFTDFMHNRIALNQIYSKLGWQQLSIDAAVHLNLDMNLGIDYVFSSAEGQKYTVQERFRDNKYLHYTDFTLRYKREHNPDKSRMLSEFFKINASHFLYGISNGRKELLESNTHFAKFALVDMKIVENLLQSGTIEISHTLRGTCKWVDGKMICPVNQNTDFSSSFVPIDIVILLKIAPQAVLLQQGYHV